MSTQPGDQFVLPGGMVGYVVQQVLNGPSWKGVRAKRIEFRRTGDNYTVHDTIEDISAKAWGDIVRAACSAKRLS